MRAIVLCILPIMVWAGSYEVIPSEESLPILTPTLQNRKTAKIRLKNGIEAYIVSDPDTDKCAVAVSVEAGSFHDPDAYPGMAHFCEHMLFMGSEKYPDENAMFAYVSAHQGMINAATWPDRTVYMFSQNPEEFAKGIDILAQFFISPLFKEDAIGRELLAVNQEHMKNVENDAWREYSIFKELSSKSHPICKFSTGTKETLGIIARSDLVEWYQKYYSSDRMHVVIYGSQPLEELIASVTESFTPVKASGFTPKNNHGKMIPDNVLGTLVTIEPFKEIKQLKLLWEIPPKYHVLAQEHIPEFAAYLLEDKGERSIFTHLQSAGFIEGLYANPERYSDYDHTFEICFTLTEKGVDNVDHIITATFEAIQNMQKQKFPEYLYTEYKNLKELEFQYQSRPSVFDYVMDCACDLTYKPLSSYPRPDLPQQFQTRQIYEFFTLLLPTRCSYYLMAPSHLTHTKCDRKTPWYDAAYNHAYLGGQRLASFSQRSVNKSLSLPTPNEYITKADNICLECTGIEITEPKVLVDEPQGICYYAKDRYYGSPKSMVSVGIRSPLFTSTPKSRVLSDIYRTLANEKLSSLLCKGQKAGQQLSFSRNRLNLEITAYGYSDKLLPFMTDYCTALQALGPFSAQDIERVQQELGIRYANREKDALFKQGLSSVQSLLTNYEFTGEELQKALSRITVEDVWHFQKHCFEHIYLETLIHGSLEEAPAKTLYNTLSSQLASPSKDSVTLPECRLRAICSTHPQKIEYQPQMLGNCALLMIQGEKNIGAHRASLRLLGSIISEQFFNTLRTEQQTGYIAKCLPKSIEEQNFICALVQSTTHNAQELLDRFELFFETFCRNLEREVPQERFTQLQQATITAIQEKPPNLLEKSQELTRLAFVHNRDFQRKAQMTQEIRNLDYEEFLVQCRTLLGRENTNRLAVLYQGANDESSGFLYRLTSTEQLNAALGRRDWWLP